MVGYLRRGEAHRQRQELDAALRDLQQASTLDPTAPRPLELLGDVNTSLARYDRAIHQYDAYLAIDDQSPRVLYKLALAHYRAGQPRDAIATLGKALRLKPRFAEAEYLLGLCLNDARRTTDALTAFSRAIDIAPALLAAREELAELYGRMGRVEDRLTQLEALVALDPGPSRSVALALAYAHSGMVDRAVPTLEQAAARYPKNAYVHVALGRIWLESAQARGDRADLDKALDELEAAVSAEDSSEALMLFGRALLLARDNELAERMLEEATRREPVDAAAFFYLAEAAERCDHPARARQALLDYRTLTGSDGEGRRAAAMAERIAGLSMRLHDPKSAARWYRRALDADDTNAALLVHLASAELDAGDSTGARSAVGRALQRDPGNAAARSLSRRLR
jgi:tetratricopeptide (TPR) repeat protein